MKAICQETKKEVIIGATLKMSLFNRPANDFSRVSVKKVIFRGISNCGSRIFIQENVFNNEWTVVTHPELFNLKIIKE